MKRSIFVAMIVIFGLAPLALGAVQIHDDIKLTGGGTTIPAHGGPFKASIFNDSGRSQGTGTWVFDGEKVENDWFYTFCVEVSENVYLGSWYDIKAIDTTSHVSTNLALSGYSAWVYDKFLDKVANNPSWNPFKSTEMRTAGLYQDMIWAGMLPFEDDPVTGNIGSWDPGEAFTDVVNGPNTENGIVSLDDPVYSDEGIAYSQFLDDSSWWDPNLVYDTNGNGVIDEDEDPDLYVKLSATKLYRVINLQDTSGGVAQDMAILIEEPVSGVPEPASLLIWSFLGLAGVSLWSRRGRESLPQRWSRRDREAIYSLIDHGRKA